MRRVRGLRSAPNAERKPPGPRRDLTAFIGEYDVLHGHKCISNSDSYLASQ